jgi:hypothetical protein
MEHVNILSAETSKSCPSGVAGTGVIPFFSRTLELVELLKNIIKSPV